MANSVKRKKKTLRVALLRRKIFKPAALRERIPLYFDFDKSYFSPFYAKPRITTRRLGRAYSLWGINPRRKNLPPLLSPLPPIHPSAHSLSITHLPTPSVKHENRNKSRADKPKKTMGMRTKPGKGTAHVHL